ncbi:hypothetical protein Ancab_008115 [Ancistrocladus abbreviatus]
MEDTTGDAAWTERDGTAEKKEKTDLNRRTKATKQYQQKDLEGTEGKGATRDMGLSEIGPSSFSPQGKLRCKKGACLLGPRKPKRDGASRSAAKKSKKGREAHQKLTLPPDGSGGGKPIAQTVSTEEAILSGISLRDSNIENRNKIDEEVFPISVVEETLKVGDPSAPFRDVKVGVFTSPSTPSTSISVVPDSLGTVYASEQQPAVANTSMAMDDLSKFKPEMNVLVNSTPIVSRPADGTVIANGRNLVAFQESSCRSEGVGRVSKPIEVEVSKPLGWVVQLDTCASCSLPGFVRPLGGFSSPTHVQISFREGVFDGLDSRPVLKNTVDI